MRPDTRTPCSVGLSLARHPEEALETVFLQEIKNTLFPLEKYIEELVGCPFQSF